jgi:hypothetical protein
MVASIAACGWVYTPMLWWPAVPFSVMGLTLSAMSRRRIAAGKMDPRFRTQANIGLVAGILGLVAGAVVVLIFLIEMFGDSLRRQ